MIRLPREQGLAALAVRAAADLRRQLGTRLTELVPRLKTVAERLAGVRLPDGAVSRSVWVDARAEGTLPERTPPAAADVLWQAVDACGFRRAKQADEANLQVRAVLSAQHQGTVRGLSGVTGVCAVTATGADGRQWAKTAQVRVTGRSADTAATEACLRAATEAGVALCIDLVQGMRAGPAP